MLSEDAYGERRWGQFPVLRIVLEGEHLRQQLLRDVDAATQCRLRVIAGTHAS